MVRLNIAVIIALAIPLIAGGCGLSAPKTVRLAAKDSGATVTLRAGDKLEVVLEGNPTTGYSWILQSYNSAILKQIGEPVYKADSGLTGAGGKFTFRFEATAAGKAVLKLVYQRPWEPKDAPVNTFMISVVVQ